MRIAYLHPANSSRSGPAFFMSKDPFPQIPFRWVSVIAGILFTMASLSAQISADQFEDISQESGFGNFYFSWGSAWGDPNGDGRPDIYVGNHYREKDHNLPFIFYQADGPFVRDTLPDFDSVKDMHGSVWMDFDEDGDDDLYIVTGRSGGNLLLVNDGTGVLRDQTKEWGLGLSESRGRTPIWFDANRDGMLDMVVTNGNPLNSVNRMNTLLVREGDVFHTSLADSLAAVGNLTGSGAMIGDPWGAGWCQLGLFTDKSLHWLLPGCLPLEQNFRWDQTDLEQVIPADFNGDGMTDLLLVRADLSQANAAVDYPINYGESFELDLINPALTTWIRTPRNGTGVLNPEGTVTYVPDPAFSGSDSLALRVCDSFDLCVPRVIYFSVSPSPSPGGAQPFPVLADSSITLKVSEVVHPFRHSLRLILFPRDTLHQAIRFRTASDSLLLEPEPSLNISADSIFIGSSGVHPASSGSFLLTKTDTTCWGSSSYVPGETRALFVHYEPATDEWIIAFNTWFYEQRLDLFAFATDSIQIAGYLNFSGEAVLSSDQLLFSNGFGYDDATAWAGIDEPNNAVAGAAADFDNDGDTDILLSCGLLEGNQPNLLWENQGNGHFLPVPMAGGATGPGVGSAGTPSVADMDGDGFLDIFLENGRGFGSGIRGPYTLLRNRGNGNAWLRLHLRGVQSPLEGVGAVTEVWSGGRRFVRVADGGQNRYSQSERIVHFGLGDALQADSLIIRWPSGIVQRLYDVPANQLLEVWEPEGQAKQCLAPAQLLTDYPGGGATIRFTWMTLPCTIGYEVQIRNNSTRVAEIYPAKEALLVLNKGRFITGQEYRWAVRVQCQDSSWGNWSAERRFTIDREATSISDPMGQTDPGYSLVPNPAGDWVDVVSTQIPRQSWRVVITDARGQIRGRQVCGTEKTCRIPLEKFESGTYSVQISQGENSRVLRLIRVDQP